MIENLYTYKAIVVRVIDGDTVGLDIDLGMNQWMRRRSKGKWKGISIRLLGIDCSEVRRGKWSKGLPEAEVIEELEDGKAAREFLKEYLPEGTEVVVTTHKDMKSFERYLADIYLDLGGGQWVSVSEEMIAHGHATRRE